MCKVEELVVQPSWPLQRWVVGQRQLLSSIPPCAIGNIMASFSTIPPTGFFLLISKKIQ